ncbi:uncharacterized protein LOC106709628 [Papilio machaon]|uniref:uncharacterized protein LOC106709628 n=1 Tax=Papilio machaon TaxID=76193 RepID=UPI001E663C5C|nr:uncharacterized protein LOC106709628 [Papilio machaon]
MVYNSRIPISGIPISRIPNSRIPNSRIPISRIPISGKPISRIPISGIPIRGIPISGIPISRIPISGIPISGIPISGIPISRIPNSRIPNSRIPISGIPISRISISRIPISRIPNSRTPNSRTPNSRIPNSRTPNSRIPISGIQLHHVSCLDKMAPLGYIKLVVAVLSVIIQISISVKSNARPVYEVINEQSKAEERQIKTSAIANLPYGNPLAGNSQQNAKLHAHNQQAMFNAEKVRQHKAQLQQQQRWLKTPQLVHNYMRAYHESQENHQLALEQEQAEFNDDTTTKEPKKYTKDTDAINLETVKQDRKRKHRSHGSVEYHTAYVPDNEAINEKPQVSNTEFIYPQYYPTQSYQSVQDIEILNSLLNKNPNDQLTEFNALLNTPKININHGKELEAPIDLYFHLKGPSKFPLPVYYVTSPPQIPSIQEIYKEFTPIKEEESEVRHKVQQTLKQPRYIEPVTKNIEYINTELTNHIVNADYNPLYQEEYKIKEEAEEEPRYQAFYVPVNNQNADKIEELSDRYLHNTNGIQHLTKDGSGVSAYDEKLKYASSYEFGYRVRDTHSGNDFGHQEEKKGEETNGQYHVLLPDGRMQNVRYSAGPEGFHADISYDH